MKEKSYIFFWKLKKNVNIETCMFAKHTLNYVLFDEISLLLLPEIPLISVFWTAAIYIFFITHWVLYFLTIQSVAIF